MENHAQKITCVPGMLLLLVVCLGLPFLTGCSTRTPSLTFESLPIQPSNYEMVLGPGDEIEIKFLLWPELNETQRIRPDGRISLQLIDNVRAAGLTTGQLKLLLEEKYQKKIKDPDILVLIRSLASQQIYVTGNVNTPGPIPLQGQMTALEAIMAAGGFSKPFVENIVIYRTTGNRVISTALKIGDYTGDNTGGADPFYVQAKDMIQVQ